MDYIISTDATCDLPESVQSKVATESMMYTVDKEHFGGNTGNNMDIYAFYAKMRDGAMTHTSQVSPADAYEYLDSLTLCGKRGVLHIPLAAALSTTSDNHMKAADEINKKYGKKLVYSVDSISQAGGLGLLVTLAQNKKESGASLQEVYEYVEKIKANVCHYFVVDNLIYLYRGGRINKASAVIGTLVRLKPLLHTDANGKLIPIQKIMSRRKSLDRLVEKMKEKFNGYSEIVYISHGDCLDDAKYVADAVYREFCIKAEIMPLCRVVGCHSGPGTVALFFTADTRNE